MRPIERPAQIPAQLTAQLTVHHYLRAHEMLAAMAERMADCNTGIISTRGCRSLIYLFSCKHDFFRHFTVKKTRLSLSAVRFSGLYLSDGLICIQM